jgi:hypothetical protein
MSLDHVAQFNEIIRGVYLFKVGLSKFLAVSHGSDSHLSLIQNLKIGENGSVENRLITYLLVNCRTVDFLLWRSFICLLRFGPVIQIHFEFRFNGSFCVEVSFDLCFLLRDLLVLKLGLRGRVFLRISFLLETHRGIVR